ncbi:MAG: carbohydrate kinase [Spirochaetales bacterium]|nr:carbohydrate kinase [Spirochaetales bacterium]
MKESYFMGIDNGGTMCKAVIFDSRGREISSASRKLTMETPRPGYTERDMEDLWTQNVLAIRSALAEAPVKADEVRAVACSGHGKGLYLWGKQDRPACRGIVSTDTRAWEYPGKWADDGTSARAFEKTCQQILACQPVSLLNWLKENNPGVLEETEWIFSVKDYIRFRLTGEAYAERTDFSGTSLMNLRTGETDRELLALFGLEEIEDRLPPLRSSTDICGLITAETAAATGLAEGTPVAGGMFDIDACALAMDITDESNLCVIAGTWSINEFISTKPILNGSIMMNSLYCLDGYYLIEECSPTSAGNLEWYVETFMKGEKEKAAALGMNLFQYGDYLVESLPPQEQSLQFLPYLFGSNYNPKARSCFVGMDPSHSQAHRIRAVFEGIVFCHMAHIDRLLANREKTRAIRLAGGAAKSLVWAQMFADVSGLPVEIIDTKELGALGCAIAGAVATGAYSGLREAAGAMVKVKKALEPDGDRHRIYREKYRRYLLVSEALDPLWGELSRPLSDEFRRFL